MLNTSQNIVNNKETEFLRATAKQCLAHGALRIQYVDIANLYKQMLTKGLYLLQFC